MLSIKSKDVELQRKEMALEPGSFQKAYHATLKDGINRSFIAASVIASDMVTTSKTGKMGKINRCLCGRFLQYISRVVVPSRRWF